MKIAFFTETVTDWSLQPLNRNHPNARTDVAWKIALRTHNYNLKDAIEQNYDWGIIIVPKKNPNLAWEGYEINKNKCRQWAVMQEGPHFMFQDWSIEIQFEYLHFLLDMDLLLCHNEIDKNYYSGLFPDRKVEILPTLMIEDSIPKNLQKVENRTGIMIGGNWTSWYSGQDSFFVARNIGSEIYAPSMGRKQNGEELIEEIKYLPYLSWSDWIVELSKRKYAVHLMRTYAAGTFQLNCAYLGIPCIGYENSDTQRICFPELSIREGDLKEAIKIAKHLGENDQFYQYCSAYAKKAWQENFSERIFIEKCNDIFTN